MGRLNMEEKKKISKKQRIETIGKQFEKKFEKLLKDEKIKSLLAEKFKEQLLLSKTNDPLKTLVDIIKTFPIDGEKKQKAINEGIKKAMGLQKELFGKKEFSSTEIFSNIIALDFLVRTISINFKMGMDLVGLTKLSQKTGGGWEGYA